MMLIAIDNDAKSVMHYLADDKSPEAIAAEVRRAGFAGHTWREITKTEYAQIRASRPKPKPVMPSLPANADAYEELVRMVQIIAQKYDEQAIEIARQRSTIDAILKAKIPLDVKQERVA